MIQGCCGNPGLCALKVLSPSRFPLRLRWKAAAAAATAATAAGSMPEVRNSARGCRLSPCLETSAPVTAYWCPLWILAKPLSLHSPWPTCPYSLLSCPKHPVVCHHTPLSSLSTRLLPSQCPRSPVPVFHIPACFLFAPLSYCLLHSLSTEAFMKRPLLISGRIHPIPLPVPGPSMAFPSPGIHARSQVTIHVCKSDT